MTRQDKITELSYQANMSNELIQKSRYTLTPIEQKAILYMASKIKPNDEPYTEYEFSAERFCEVCNFNMDGGWYIQRVREVCMELAKKPLVIKLDKYSEVITSWITYAELNSKTGTFKVAFSKHLTPYLYELQKCYTSITMQYVLPMKSEYGIRLYGYLKSVKFMGYRHTLTIDELKQRTGCEGKYEFFKDLRRFVIEPALKDINTFSDLEVGCNFIKTGKKVSHIEFIVKDGDNITRHNNRVRALGMRER